MSRPRLLLAGAAALAVAAAAPQTLAAGSLTVSPAIVEHVAAKGPVGSVTIGNSTGATLKVTVTPRPWVQSRATGVVTPNRTKTLGGQVSASAKSFTLASGANKTVSLSLLKVPSSRSLYGAVEVVGLPTKKPKNGILAGYRLIPSLRLNPATSARKYSLQAGGPRVSRGQVVVGVRNAGNTIDPITGDTVVTGPSGTQKGTLGTAGRRILPGGIVDIPLANTKKLAHGTYKTSISLRQGGKLIKTVKGTIKI
jgi:hypothetical protein